MEEYGPPGESLAKIAKLWSAYLSNRGTNLDGGDVAALMLLLKVCRESYAHKQDNIVDGHAYLMLWEQFFKGDA